MRLSITQWIIYLFINQESFVSVVLEPPHLDMDEYYGVGLRPYQKSIHYCIYPLNVLDRESRLIVKEAVDHIDNLYTLSQ